MRIGSKYADNRLYRGIKYYDKRPLMSEDIHEYADTMYMKNAYIMNNILGWGILNSPSVEIDESSGGIVLEEPSVVLIDGDISLIQSDEGKPIVPIDLVRRKGAEEGIVCILGWYQHITSGSTMRNWGGVDNEILENNLINEEFQLQISSRYQFRWFPILFTPAEYDNIARRNFDMIFRNRDIDGNEETGTISTRCTEVHNDVLVCNNVLEYSESPLYLVPLVKYLYSKSSDTIHHVSAWEKLGVGTTLFTQNTMPEGNIPNGTIWINPDTREFNVYVEDLGQFISSTSRMAFLKYQSVHVESEDRINPEIAIDIEEFEEGDILQVVYEGALLVEETEETEGHYTIDYDKKSITLLRDFNTAEGDKIYFDVTKIVEASNITSITTKFLDHMNTTASDTREGHVKLSDTMSNSGSHAGIAATPVALQRVHDNLSSDIERSKLLVDDITSLSYRLGIDNGLLYIEEV